MSAGRAPAASAARAPAPRAARAPRSRRDEQLARAPGDAPKRRSGPPRASSSCSPNGSGFVRVESPEQCADDVYISSAQARRCELVSGDRVSGPVRAPPLRAPPLARPHRHDQRRPRRRGRGRHPLRGPGRRLAQRAPRARRQRPHAGGDRAADPARPWLAGGDRRRPLRGQERSLRRIAVALQAAAELTLSAVLVGVRPEEVTQWQDGPLAPEAALTFAASADAQAQALERAPRPRAARRHAEATRWS